MENRPDEPAGGSAEPPVQEREEADHIARRRVWLPIAHQGIHPLRQSLISDGAEEPALHSRVLRGPCHVAGGPRIVAGHGCERSRALAGWSGEDGGKKNRRQERFCASAGGKESGPPWLLL